MWDPMLTSIYKLKTLLISTVLWIVHLLVFRPSKERRRLATLTKNKQNERKVHFYQLRSQYIFGSKQQEIVNLEWDLLVQKLQSRELSATDVLEAFIVKALKVSLKCNPVTEFISDAQVWARELDAMETVKGPLHGIPFCVKDDTDVIGMDTTHGYAKRLNSPATESAVIVRVLQDLGAVPFCKTNVPQTLWSYGSDNPIFGKTLNAHNPKLSPGGSSSGTGALVAAGGAPFGTGTDIGGSLRIPACWNGVSSLKPTSTRFSIKGCASPIPKAVGVGPSVGIIAQNPTIVAYVVRKMVESGLQLEYDPLALPIPWNNFKFECKEKLRIGYFTSLPFFPTIGDSGQMVLNAKGALESLGHTVVPFELPDAYNYMRVLTNIMTADQTRHLKKCWHDEAVGECVQLVWLLSKIPLCLLGILRRILLMSFLPVSSKRLAVFFKPSLSTSNDVWEAIAEQREIRQQILNQWETLKLDALVCSVLPVPAPPIDDPTMIPSPYAVIFNLVDFPAGVVTMGSESGTKLNEFDDDGDFVLKTAKKGVKESIGAPVGIQVVGKPMQEEIVLRIMKELEPFNTFIKT